MDLLVIRHAIAEDRDEFAETGKDDAQRPLTRDGRQRMAAGAAGLRALVPTISMLATSPLVRARQTAEIVAKVYEIDVTETTDVLEPDASPGQLVEWAEPYASLDVIAVVGHEPHLGE